MPSETLRVNMVAGSQRNYTVHVTGVITSEMTLTPVDLKVNKLKLASLAWLVQEKLGLYLWWNKETVLLPMESRNAIRFDTSIVPPEGWDGKIWLSSFGFVAPKKIFFLVMDFDK